MTEKKRRGPGGPPPKGLEARKEHGNVCTAKRSNGQPCANFAINGSHVCRIHGGAAPQVRARAQVRILMASDLAARKLIEMLSNPRVADNIKLAAAKDLLDRANLAGTQNIQIGVTPEKSFADWVGEALVDVEEDDDSNVIDAEVIEDDSSPLIPRDEVQNNRDRAVFAEVERAARGRAMERTGGTARAELERAEREALGMAPRREQPRRAGGRSDDVHAMNAQQDAEDAELERVKAAERRRNEARNVKRARVTDATMSQKRRGER